jgi:hypothetical protein
VSLTVDPSALFDIRWIHVFEEDGAGEQVYQPASGPIPLSRRPREGLTLHADGTATVEAGGADDRPVRHQATWRRTAQGLVVDVPTAGGGSTELHIVRASPDRLVVAPPRG